MTFHIRALYIIPPGTGQGMYAQGRRCTQWQYFPFLCVPRRNPLYFSGFPQGFLIHANLVEFLESCLFIYL